MTVESLRKLSLVPGLYDRRTSRHNTSDYADEYDQILARLYYRVEININEGIPLANT